MEMAAVLENMQSIIACPRKAIAPSYLALYVADARGRCCRSVGVDGD